MARKRTTISLDPKLLEATRAAAAQRGVSTSDVVEEALREHFRSRVAGRAWRSADLPEDEARRIAIEALRAVRARRSA